MSEGGWSPRGLAAVLAWRSVDERRGAVGRRAMSVLAAAAALAVAGCAITPSGANVGAVAIEQERAIAEVQGQLILAKRFPRDLNGSYAELMESCSLPAMANQAFYSVPKINISVRLRTLIILPRNP